MKACLTIEADLAHLSDVREFIHKHACKVCQDENYLYDLTLAVDEAVTNIIVHGYRGQPGWIQVILEEKDGGLEVILRDGSPPFDPTQVPAPNLNLPLEKRKAGGLGVYLARELTDCMAYCCLPEGGNELRLVKRCPDPVAK